MNDRLETMDSLARRAWRSMALALFVLFAGCGGGPGTGGTGTGPDAAPAAPALSGVVVYVANTPAPAAPGSPAAFEPDRGPCTSPCGRAELVLRESLVELTVPCARFTSTAAWDAGAAQSEIPGTYTAADGSTRPATLRLQFEGTPATAASVTLTVLDAQRATLSGPAVLQRDAGGTGGAPGCP